MKIGIFGTGMVGQTIGGALLERGHDVMIGTRDVAATLARTDPNPMGLPPFSVWSQQHPQARLGSYAETAAHGDVLVNATSGTGSLDVLALAGAANLDSKILIDISNPLDFSRGMPPSLTVCNTDSTGEQIQRAYPNLKVVKTLNTVTAALMVNPGLVGGGDHTLFVCGDDQAAKARVTGWLGEWFGWTEIIDLGDITNARGTEMLLPLWVRLYGALQTGMFNFKVVK